MPRVSGLEQFSEEAIDKGQLHSVKIDLDSTLLYGSELTKSQLEDILHSGHGLVTPEYADVLRTATRHEVFRGKMIEPRRSAHGVTFGRFVGPKPHKKSGEGSILTVAMKPFGEAQHAITEFLGYRILQEIGVETYKPVGIFPSEFHNNFIVITKKRGDAVSLDRDDWMHGRQITSEEEIEIAERNTRTVQDIARLMAWVHLNGVFLHDGQIKNWFVTYYGKIGAFDTENLTTRPLGHPDTASLQRDDFSKLMKSLTVENKEAGKIFGVGMLAGFSPDQVRAAARELVIEPYLEVIEQKALEGPNIDITQADMLDQSARGILSDPDWSERIVVAAA